MITSTSLMHPRARSAIRSAAFAAAAKLSEAAADACSFRTAYAQRVDGASFLRIDVGRQMPGWPVIVRAWRGNRNHVGDIALAMGSNEFIYMHRLCDALASPATEKVW